MHTDDQRLIEYGFPCHQVGAETQRERDTGELIARVETKAAGDEILRVDERVLRQLQEEQRRAENRALIAKHCSGGRAPRGKRDAGGSSAVAGARRRGPCVGGGRLRRQRGLTRLSES
jgi:hypothetical protein